MSGFLVTIEGIDGSGKSTLMESLSAPDFGEIASTVTFTREPTDSAAGKLLRDILANDNADAFTELFLFMADHSTHVNSVIEPAIANNELVICDRYIDSRCAYQGHTLDGEIANPIQFIYGLHGNWSRFPDVTVYLDIDPEIAANRTSTGEKYEVPDRLAEIRENYRELMRVDDRFVVVDAEQPIEAVCDEAIKKIHDTLLDSH